MKAVTLGPLIAIVLAAACGTSTPAADDPGASAAPAGTPEAVTSLEDLFEPVQEWEVISDDLNVTLATPDLAVGPQRFAVVLSDRQGLIRLPVVRAETYRYPEGFENASPRVGPVESANARFTEFPFGTRGIYVTQFEFAEQGDWSVEVDVPRTDGSFSTAEVRFQVAETTQSVPVGERPPASVNKTLADVEHIGQLTTGSFHDPDLYRLTIAEARDNGRPTVVVFASPAFCTNAVCGPQVEVAGELKERYGADIDFIHVDLFENPDELQGDLNRAIPSRILTEWGLVSQEWTYVLDERGLVTARFENFVPAAELESAITSVLASG